MFTCNHIIGSDEIALLAGEVGKKLVRFEGYELFSEADCGTFNSHIKLVFEDETLNLRCAYKLVNIAGEEAEDAGVLSVSSVDAGIWTPEGISPTKVDVRAKVINVGFANDHDVMAFNDTPQNELMFTQAIIFDLGGTYLVFDKGPFIENFIEVRQGKDYEPLLTDCSASWWDEPGWTDAHERKIAWLAN